MRSVSLCGPYTGCTDNCQMRIHEVVEAVFRLPLQTRDGLRRKFSPGANSQKRPGK